MRVELPPYKRGCLDNRTEAQCDYPVRALKKTVSSEWAGSAEQVCGRRAGCARRALPVTRCRPNMQRLGHWTRIAAPVLSQGEPRWVSKTTDL